MATLFQRTCYCDPALHYLQRDTFCDLDSSFWLLPLKEAVVPTSSCLITHGSSGTQELCCHNHVCPSMQKGHLVLRYIWHAWGHLAWHRSLPSVSCPESKIGMLIYFSLSILSDWGTEILIYWNIICISFSYRSSCRRIKGGEIRHYRRTTVTFMLKVRSKRFCDYRCWD